ncbi:MULTISPECIES: FeoA family protein [Jonquetella]|uniref:FeoA-like protein n=1 Tax=Jonquetella anthropi DSM 22815 TaxID=885272 RepID=H0UMH3_9BACT|nr:MULTISPECIES: FeoA family protein [Jonquetella]EEX48235.1 FeoA domain protein [Jonquetella anthropi E3_33 E1]EHM13676.1 FeoA-like protein [Jonquetella anthropi DSM 22815]ERL24421.1 FeoA domain protein [Jonquetella sp. BV3C21]
MGRKMSDCASGEKVLIRAVEITDKATLKRLADLGIFPGSAVEICKNVDGQIIIGVAEARVSIERLISSQIIVA